MSAVGLPRHAYRRLRKKSKRILSHLWLAALKIINQRATTPVLGDAAVIVSLTTVGARLDTVAYTIESIASGRVRPCRLILWLDDPEAFAQRPASLRRLEERGLEVGLTENLGPHTKYFPTLSTALSDGLPLVTADDDILYPRRWLSDLLAAAELNPGTVNCYRASVIALDGDAIAPYDSWPRCKDTSASVTRFATGVSGVFYPMTMVAELHRRDKGFCNTAPRADDLWLHWVALRSGTAVRQISSTPRHFPFIPGTQETSLVSSNVGAGANDVQIAALYEPEDVATLAAAGAQDISGSGC